VKTKVSPAIVGAFVIGAMLLGVIALFSFGSINFFAKPQRFVVYFDESIHGLDLGSQVKLRGVRVGRVVSLAIRYDEKGNRSVVAVVCEFSKDVMTDNLGMLVDVANRAELEKLVSNGLRAQLGVQSLATGMLFVALDFFDPKEYPPEPRPADPRFTVVPSVPSAISEFQASASDILASLKRVDFAGISRGINSLLTESRRHLDGVDLKGVTEQWKRTGAELEALAKGPELKATLDNLNGAVTDLRKVVATLEAQIEPTSRELTDTLVEARKTIQNFNETAAAARTLIQANSGVGDDLALTLTRLNDAADSVRRLAEFLERNPNALITGRKRPQ